VSQATALTTAGEIFAANRIASRIAFAAKSMAGATRRDRLAEEGALRLRCPGSAARELEAVIVNTGGGMAGGDRFDLDIAAGPQSHLVVTTAAAEKIYRAHERGTAGRIRLQLAAGSELAWLPQETIMFDGARLKRTIDVEMAEDARLLLAEAVVFGRNGMGEAVVSGSLFDRWRFRRNGALLYAETVRLDGAIADMLRWPAVAKGGIAIATVVVVPADEALVESIRVLHGQFLGEVGVSTWNGFAVVRLVAPDGAALRHDLGSVLTSIRGENLPRLWLC